MAELGVKQLIIGLILFSLGIALFTAILSEFTIQDPNFMSDTDMTKFKTLNRSINIYADLQDSTDTISTVSEIDEDDTSFFDFGVIGGLVNSAWTTMKLIGNSALFSMDFLSGIVTFFFPNLTVPIASYLVMIVTVIVGFSIAALIFNRSF